MKTYTQETIQAQLVQLNDWTFKHNSIQKDFLFKNFQEALSFIVRIGILAE